MELDSSNPDLELSDPRIINYKGNDYLTTMSHLRLVHSKDGINFKKEKDFPAIFSSDEYESCGIEDCRVTKIEETYYLTYTVVSRNGVVVGLMSTKNRKYFIRYGLILPTHNKDCAIFDTKINGKYFMLHRPSSPELGGKYFWIADSSDLLHWGNHKCIAHTRKGMWDNYVTESGGIAQIADRGILMLYNEGARYEEKYFEVTGKKWFGLSAKSFSIKTT